MSTSIFPEVRVTQIRPIAFGDKPVPQMTVGLVGPMFKLITETSVNGYAIEPETAPSIEVNLSAPTDSQYIDYDSMQVQLVVNSTDEVVTLNPKDKEVTTVYDVIKSGIDISTSYGYLKATDNPDGYWMFYPSTGAKINYGAQTGDWLHRTDGEDTILLNIAQVTPLKISGEAFSAPTSLIGKDYVFPSTSDLTDKRFSSPTNLFKGTYLVAIKKSDKSKIYQYHINYSNAGEVMGGPPDIPEPFVIGCKYLIEEVKPNDDFTNVGWTQNGVPFIATDNVPTAWTTTEVTVFPQILTTEAPLSDDLIAETDMNLYDWYAYDMPFGGLKLYAPDGYTVPVGLGEASDTSTYKYSIFSYNTKIGFDKNYATTVPTKFGAFIKSGDYIFLSDKRDNTDLVGVNLGDYLQASNGTNTFKFRITKVNGSILKSNLNVPSAWDGGAKKYTFAAGTTFTEITGLENKSFLIARKKGDSTVSKIYKITTINEHSATPNLIVSNLDFSLSQEGLGNDFIATGFSNYNWYIMDMPLGSLKVDVPNETEFALCSEDNALGYDFNIINAADFYVSGKQAVTIKNYIADSLGNEIGLADVIFTYRVLETENATQMFNITSQTLRTSICGDVSNVNPLGLAAGLLEVNTALTYKVIPTDIAFSERDPDNPKPYVGQYMPGEDNPNYHNVNNLDWLGTKEVLNSVKETQAPYYLVPLTNDESVLGMFHSTVLALSDPGKKKEMVLFTTTSLPTSETVLGNINPMQADFTLNSKKLRYKPTSKYVSETQPSVAIQFLGIGAKKGDYVSFYNKAGQEQLLKIENIYASYFDLGTTSYTSVSELFTDIDTDVRFTIKKIYANKSDIANALVKKAAKYNSFRTKLIWGGDYVDVSLGGVTFVSMPTFYAAAAYAGMANNNGTVVPKTERTINGISKTYNVTPFFSADDLEVIGAGYVDVLNQEFDGAPVASMRQFMTDGSELSGVEPVDEYAKYLRQLFRPLLGKNNITNALFDVLGIALTTSIENFVPSRFQAMKIVEGMKVSGANKDRISLKLKPTTYKPFNGLDIEIQL